MTEILHFKDLRWYLISNALFVMPFLAGWAFVYGLIYLGLWRKRPRSNLFLRVTAVFATALHRRVVCSVYENCRDNNGGRRLHRHRLPGFERRQVKPILDGAAVDWRRLVVRALPPVSTQSAFVLLQPGILRVAWGIFDFAAGHHAHRVEAKLPGRLVAGSSVGHRGLFVHQRELSRGGQLRKYARAGLHGAALLHRRDSNPWRCCGCWGRRRTGKFGRPQNCGGWMSSIFCSSPSRSWICASRKSCTCGWIGTSSRSQPAKRPK